MVKWIFDRRWWGQRWQRKKISFQTRSKKNSKTIIIQKEKNHYNSTSKWELVMASNSKGRTHRHDDEKR